MPKLTHKACRKLSRPNFIPEYAFTRTHRNTCQRNLIPEKRAPPRSQRRSNKNHRGFDVLDSKQARKFERRAGEREREREKEREGAGRGRGGERERERESTRVRGDRSNSVSRRAGFAERN